MLGETLASAKYVQIFGLLWGLSLSGLIVFGRLNTVQNHGEIANCVHLVLIVNGLFATTATFYFHYEMVRLPAEFENVTVGIQDLWLALLVLLVQLVGLLKARSVFVASVGQDN